MLCGNKSLFYPQYKKKTMRAYKRLLFVMLFFVTLNIFSQNKRMLDLSYAGLTTNFPNFNFYHGHNFNCLYPVGLSVQYKVYLTKRIAFSTGVEMFYKYYHQQTICDYSDIKHNYFLIDIPVYFSLNIISRQKFDFFLKTGIKNIFSNDIAKDLLSDTKKVYYKYYGYSFCPGLGLGGQFRITEKAYIFIETMINYKHQPFPYRSTLYMDAKLGVSIPID
jgi:hypothetical protein